MEVQIFGHKKDPATRAAQRFFAERRITVHFVDFMDRWPSLGELKRFAQKFGAEALLDRGGKTFAERGLKAARYGEERWLQVLAEDPWILRVPLVRWQHKLTVGAAEPEWTQWVEADKAGGGR